MPVRSRLLSLLLCALSVVVSVRFTVAQSTPDPQNDTGVRPNRAYAVDEEIISLATGTVNLDIPLVHLAGRAGHDVDLKWHVSSNIWSPIESSSTIPYQNGTITQYLFVWQNSGEYGYVNIPTFSGTTGYVPGTNNAQLCMYSPTLQTPDGAIYTFQRASYGCNFVGGGVDPNYDIPVVLDDQNGGIVFDGTDPNHLVASMPDGSMYVSKPNGLEWVDKNGNTISYVRDPKTNIVTITDTLERVITVTPPQGGGGTGSDYIIRYPGPSNTPLQVTIAGSLTSTTDTCYLNQVGGGPDLPYNLGTQNVNPVLAEAAWAFTMPNGGTFTIGYNGCGEPTLVTYPTGGYTKYTYSTNQYQRIYYEPAGQPITSVSGNLHYVIEKDKCPSAIIPFGTATPPNPSSLSCPGALETTLYTPGTGSMAVTTPDGTVTTHKFGGDGGGSPITTSYGTTVQNPYNPVEIELDVTSGSTLMEKVVTDLASDNVHPIRKTYTVGGSVRKEEWDWQQTSIGSYLTNAEDQSAWDTKEHREYDWGTLGSGQPGSLLRRTDPTWNASAYSAGPGYYAHQKLLEAVYAGSSTTPSSKSTYDYDNYTHIPGGMQVSGAVSHGGLTIGANTYQYGTSYKARNNLTGVSRWRNTDGATLSSYNQYDDAGNIVAVQDPRGYISKMSFADNWVDAACAPTGASAAYLTSVTNALSQSASFYYNSCSGLPARKLDLNSNSTQYFYDPYNRITQEEDPDGGGQITTYTDSQNLIDVKKALDGSRSIESQNSFDGLGRLTQSRLLSDPAGTVYTDTAYDTMDRVQSVSNPYRTKQDLTYGLTSYTYDALSRKTIQAQSDGSSYQYWCYNNIPSGSNSKYCSAKASSLSTGTWVDFTDEASNHWQRLSDGLGRLTAVNEPDQYSNTTVYETDYQYDALSNLKQVDQYGGAAGSSSYPDHQRLFTYDSLSNLLTSSNPEAGTVCYGTLSGSACQSGYDANGNLQSKTDARGVVTNYGYDPLNRLVSKSNPAYLTSCYLYDGSEANGTGHLASEWTQTSTACPKSVPTSGTITLRTIQAYDQMGRIKTEQQCAPGGSCTTNSGPQLWYGYDLSGDRTCLVNSAASTTALTVGTPPCLTGSYGTPSGLLLTNGYDPAGHLQTITSNWTAYPTNIYTLGTNGYGPVGPMSWTLGSNVAVTESYTNRLRVNSISVVPTTP